MIDRCFALWQVLYPDSYVEPMAAVNPTFTYPKGSVEDVNSRKSRLSKMIYVILTGSALAPFHSDTQGTNWTSAKVINTNTFGYTYPELLNDSNQASVKSAINNLYGNTAGSTTVSKDKNKNRRSATDNIGSAASVQGTATGNSTSYEYIANVVSQKFAMGSSYAVYLFLGNYSSNSNDWGTDPNLVGIHGVFANIASDPSLRKLGRRGMDDLLGTGSVPLTTTLISKVATGQLSSLSPGHVEAYLMKNLDWRAAYFDGTEIPIESVIDLSISVVQALVQPATSDDEFPTWGKFTSLVNVTAGQPGGHNQQYWPSIENEINNTASTLAKIITVTSTNLLPLSSCCGNSSIAGLTADVTLA